VVLLLSADYEEQWVINLNHMFMQHC
jgi:hypothetical protein